MDVSRNIQHFCPSGFEKIFFFLFICKNSFLPPVVTPPFPWVWWFNQTLIYTSCMSWRCSIEVTAFLSKWFLGRLKKNSLYIPILNFNPRCSLTLTPSIMIWTDLNLHYLKMLKLKFFPDQFLYIIVYLTPTLFLGSWFEQKWRCLKRNFNYSGQRGSLKEILLFIPM